MSEMATYEDPIVEDTHKTRAKLLKRYGGSAGYAALGRKKNARQFRPELLTSIVDVAEAVGVVQRRAAETRWMSCPLSTIAASTSLVALRLLSTV